MDPITLIVSFAVALVAAGLSTWTGFGAATILTPVLASFLDLREAIVVVAVFHGLSNAVKVGTFFSSVSWRVSLLFGPTAVLCSVLGGMLSALAPVFALKVILGLFLVGDSGAGMLGRESERRDRSGYGQAALGGALSGLAAGIIGAGGAVRAFFLHHFLREKQSYVATSAVIAFLIDASRVPVYLSQYRDIDGAAILPLIVTTVVAGFAGVMLARHFLTRVENAEFRRVVFASLLLAGAWFVIDGVWEGLAAISHRW